MKNKSSVFEVILDRCVSDPDKIRTGDFEVNLSAAEIKEEIDEIETTKTVMNCLKRLKDDKFIDFEVKPRTKLRKITLKNVLFCGKLENEAYKFSFDEDFLSYLLMADLPEMCGKGLFQFAHSILLRCSKLAEQGIFAVPDLYGEKDMWVDFMIFELPLPSPSGKIFADSQNEKAKGPKQTGKVFSELDTNQGNGLHILTRNLGRFSPIWENFRRLRQNSGDLYIRVEKDILYRVQELYYKKNYLNIYRSSENLTKLRNISQSEFELLDKAIGENKMSEDGFIAKTRKKYKQGNKSSVKQKVPETGDLFPKNQDGWEDEFNTIKRTIDQTPLSAYKTHDWMSVFKLEFSKIRSKNYVFRDFKNEVFVLSNKVFPMVFTELGWSAKDFYLYLRRRIEEKKKDGSFVPLDIRSILGSDNGSYGGKTFKERRIQDMKDFTDERQRIRSASIFEELTYIPHQPLGEIELFDAIDYCNTRPIGILFNYGICNYHRYLQLKPTDEYPNGLDVDGATRQIGKIFIEDIYQNLVANNDDPDVARQIVKGIFKSTTLWEPYYDYGNNKTRRLVVDWRKKWRKVWKGEHSDVSLLTWDLSEESWWSNEPNHSLKRLSPVEELFRTRKKIQREGLIV